MPEALNAHSEHYRECATRIEPIDILIFAPFALGNCLKYVIRAGHKESIAKDAEKARTYMTYIAPHDFEECERFIETYGHILRKWDRLNDVYTLEDLTRVIDSLVDRGC